MLLPPLALAKVARAGARLLSAHTQRGLAEVRRQRGAAGDASRRAELLAEASVLAVLVGSSMKFDGRFVLQTRTDGPVSLLIADFSAPDAIRAYARFDREGVDGAVRSEEHTSELQSH